MTADPVIAVVGLGTMGSGVGVAALAAGLQVRVVDGSPAESAARSEALLGRLRAHVDAGLLPESALPVEDQFVPCRSIAEACAGADLVVEAVPERWDVKRAVLEEIGSATPVVVASNTSSFPVDELARFLTDPGRFLGVHFFNPAEWIPGVELVPGSATEPGAVAVALAMLARLGKEVTSVRSSPGFLANRIQLALFAECLRCVDEGLATPEEIDRVVRSTFGFRLPAYGPFAVADMAGLDVYGSILTTLSAAYGERFEIPASLQKLLDEGSYGVKTGRGFGVYSDREAEELHARRDTAYARISLATGTTDPSSDEHDVAEVRS